MKTQIFKLDETTDMDVEILVASLSDQIVSGKQGFYAKLVKNALKMPRKELEKILNRT